VSQHVKACMWEAISVWMSESSESSLGRRNPENPFALSAGDAILIDPVWGGSDSFHSRCGRATCAPPMNRAIAKPDYFSCDRSDWRPETPESNSRG
jgi:hypothetical protein